MAGLRAAGHRHVVDALAQRLAIIKGVLAWRYNRANTAKKRR
jgi:hypothetical protein